VTPGEAELARRELDLADEALRGARLLLDAGERRGGASRLYYSAFHAARAALAVAGLYAKTHSGQIGLFTATFGPAPLLGSLLELRAEADYGREAFTTSVEELRALCADAEDFLARCRTIVEDALARGPDEPDAPPDY
jgi:uncharacterized protein (UPF0332 family)